jgi:hypothetical protein
VLTPDVSSELGVPSASGAASSEALLVGSVGAGDSLVDSLAAVLGDAVEDPGADAVPDVVSDASAAAVVPPVGFGVGAFVLGCFVGFGEADFVGCGLIGAVEGALVGAGAGAWPGLR